MTKRALGACAIAALGFAVGCSQVLGLKDPQLEDAGAPIDAVIDGPTMASDAMLDAAIDGPAIDAPIDGAPVCDPTACPFGCDPDTQACRDGKLWLFLTAGRTIGNGFGGIDTPPNPRGGADQRCRDTYANTPAYVARQCTLGNVHAILFVSATDSIAGMLTNYGIPGDAPVHRATDAIQVANTWPDLLDPNKQLLAPASTLTSDESFVWTGANQSDHCANWTMGVAGLQGGRGNATATAGWLNRDTNRCDRTAGLICVCW